MPTRTASVTTWTTAWVTSTPLASAMAIVPDADGDGVCDDAETLGCDDPLPSTTTERHRKRRQLQLRGLETPDGFGFMTGPAA